MAIEKGNLFPAALATETFNKVKGHSSLAKMSGAQPLLFNGNDVFVFDSSADVAIVGESAAKPAQSASVTSVQIRPIKVVFQHRVSDEFLTASEEARINILRDFSELFAVKLARGLDLMAMHGINPYDAQASDIIGQNYFDAKIPSGNKVVYQHDDTAVDANIDEAISKVADAEKDVNGIIISPAVRSALAAMMTGLDANKYPEFRFGAIPPTLGTAKLDVNSTVSANSAKARVYVGDFANAFRWGIAKELPLEVIRYGNPDGGTYDLKQCNQVCLRSEAYIGWGILDPDAFSTVYVNP